MVDFNLTAVCVLLLLPEPLVFPSEWTWRRRPHVLGIRSSSVVLLITLPFMAWTLLKFFHSGFGSRAFHLGFCGFSAEGVQAKPLRQVTPCPGLTSEGAQCPSALPGSNLIFIQ